MREVIFCCVNKEKLKSEGIFSNHIILFDFIESRLNISTVNDHVRASMLSIVFIFSQYVNRCLKIKGGNETF